MKIKNKHKTVEFWRRKTSMLGYFRQLLCKKYESDPIEIYRGTIYMPCDCISCFVLLLLKLLKCCKTAKYAVYMIKSDIKQKNKRTIPKYIHTYVNSKHIFLKHK